MGAYRNNMGIQRSSRRSRSAVRWLLAVIPPCRAAMREPTSDAPLLSQAELEELTYFRDRVVQRRYVNRRRDRANNLSGLIPDGGVSMDWRSLTAGASGACPHYPPYPPVPRVWTGPYTSSLRLGSGGGA